MLSTRFAHIALNCKDLDAVEAFYCRYFGFRRARLIDLGADRIVFLKSDDCYLELFNAKSEQPFAAPVADGPQWPGVRHIAFTVDNVDAKLAELGREVTLSLGPAGFDAFIPGWRTAWVKDPEGNIVEITQGFRDDESLVEQASQQMPSRQTDPMGCAS
jgi:glyoxylase I family protein